MILAHSSLFLLAALGVSAASTTKPANACASAPYSALLPLSKYAAAVSFCSSKFPVPAKTVTRIVSTQVTTTSTTTTTATSISLSTSTIVELTTEISTSTVGELPSTTLTVIDTAPSVVHTTTGCAAGAKAKREASIDPPSAVRNQAAALLWVELQAASFISTLCSCIETPVTRTVTSTYTRTATAFATSVVIVQALHTVFTTSIATIPSVPSTTFTSVSTALETSTQTIVVTSATARPTPISCGTYPTCDPRHLCPNQVLTDGQACACYQLVSGGSACHDTSVPIPKVPCNSDCDCEDGFACFVTCAGQMCQAVSNECANAVSASRLFRKDMAQAVNVARWEAPVLEPGPAICGNDLC